MKNFYNRFQLFFVVGRCAEKQSRHVSTSPLISLQYQSKLSPTMRGIGRGLCFHYT